MLLNLSGGSTLQWDVARFAVLVYYDVIAVVGLYLAVTSRRTVWCAACAAVNVNDDCGDDGGGGDGDGDGDGGGGCCW